MHKQITQERILKAIEAIHRRRKTACQREKGLLVCAATAGMKMANNIPIEESKKAIELEAALLGISSNPVALMAAMNSFFGKISHYEKWEDIVLNLQASHGVSGLNPHTFKIGPYGIVGLWCDSGLQVLESDLPRLAAQKYKVYRFWADFVEKSWQKEDKFLYIWRKTKNGHSLVDLRFVSWQCLEAGWCNVWQEEDRYYLALGSGIDLYECSALFVAAREIIYV